MRAKTHLGKLLLPFFLVVGLQSFGQTIGSVKTEEFTADFEKKKSLEALPPYNGTVQIPIQILKIGISEDVYEMYPELKDARVGMGVTNIVLEYLMHYFYVEKNDVDKYAYLYEYAKNKNIRFISGNLLKDKFYAFRMMRNLYESYTLN